LSQSLFLAVDEALLWRQIDAGEDAAAVLERGCNFYQEKYFSFNFKIYLSELLIVLKDLIKLEKDFKNS